MSLQLPTIKKLFIGANQHELTEPLRLEFLVPHAQPADELRYQDLSKSSAGRATLVRAAMTDKALLTVASAHPAAAGFAPPKAGWNRAPVGARLVRGRRASELVSQRLKRFKDAFVGMPLGVWRGEATPRFE